MGSPEIAVVLRLLDEAFETRAWHGPNLKGSLRGVTEPRARWSPGPRRHSIWGLALHAAYWKYAVRRKLTGETRGSFPIPGSNFFSLEGRDWAADRKLLDEQHRLLRDAVSRLDTAPSATERILRGAALHDIYHAGQITLIKRLMRSAGELRSS